MARCAIESYLTDINDRESAIDGSFLPSVQVRAALVHVSHQILTVINLAPRSSIAHYSQTVFLPRSCSELEMSLHSRPSRKREASVGTTYVLKQFLTGFRIMKT